MHKSNPEEEVLSSKSVPLVQKFFRFSSKPETSKNIIWKSHTRGNNLSLPSIKPKVTTFPACVRYCKKLESEVSFHKVLSSGMATDTLIREVGRF